MHRLVTLALAVASIAKASPAQQQPRDGLIIYGDADFDDLVPGHPIGLYGALTFSNLDVQDLSDLGDRDSYGAWPLSGNNVAVFSDTAGRGSRLPAVRAQHRGSVTDAFDMKSFNWGCVSSVSPCQLVVTGHRGGKRVASATFTASTDGGSVNEATFGSDFEDLDKLKFHPYRAGSIRRATTDEEVTWIDNFQYTYFIGGREVVNEYGTVPLPTTTQSVSDIFITTTSDPTITVPPFPDCGETCFSGLNDCLEPTSTCFTGCLEFPFGFPDPNPTRCSTAIGDVIITSDANLPPVETIIDICGPCFWDIDDCGQAFETCFDCTDPVPRLSPRSICLPTSIDATITTYDGITSTATPSLPSVTDSSWPILPAHQQGRPLWL
ncbi:hypothetical protein PFICI_08755 [Pestalotiopsis fici W106-1]|uniref:Uncharacterized protein n=1 Tax=Pestalotiopsis fici (strain W106-1 / CGMCC3.15140) TaxID=1229662 RepID=W3X0K9_PESFW|nr:uncharacterized protein PFICI_08755 [Pestalotiopsis fici W106-1]ETS78902.1 hypothetical protein PFICI_08755 [Pestalotiopsis fici W106-1]